MLMVSCLCVYILKNFGIMVQGQIINNEKKEGPSATVVEKFTFHLFNSEVTFLRFDLE